MVPKCDGDHFPRIVAHLIYAIAFVLFKNEWNSTIADAENSIII